MKNKEPVATLHVGDIVEVYGHRFRLTEHAAYHDKPPVATLTPVIMELEAYQDKDKEIIFEHGEVVGTMVSGGKVISPLGFLDAEVYHALMRVVKCYKDLRAAEENPYATEVAGVNRMHLTTALGQLVAVLGE